MERRLIGFAMCGSFCTHAASLEAMRELAIRHELLPIFSYSAATKDTRFGTAAELISQAEKICGRRAVTTIEDAEPLGPRTPLDALIISPCTGNTIAKLACAVTDTPVTMAAKAHLRGDRLLLLALASNDAMSANLTNIGTMLGRKNIFMVPMRQDDTVRKPHSLVADFRLLPDALEAAFDNRQIRPLFI